jgi:hypothetical protein
MSVGRVQFEGAHADLLTQVVITARTPPPR